MPFETVAIDFITKLPLSQGYDSILTITDHDCTKAAIFIPCNKEINAEETAALYLKQVVTNFGLPSKVISDRDLRFASKFTRELCKMMGIEQNISTAYHPRTDGHRNAPTNGSKRSLDLSLTTNRMIGHGGYRWHNSRTTIGPVTPQGSPRSSF